MKAKSKLNEVEALTETNTQKLIGGFSSVIGINDHSQMTAAANKCTSGNTGCTMGGNNCAGSNCFSCNVPT